MTTLPLWMFFFFFKLFGDRHTVRSQCWWNHSMHAAFPSGSLQVLSKVLLVQDFPLWQWLLQLIPFLRQQHFHFGCFFFFSNCLGIDIQYVHNADETTLCMLRSLQAACSGSTPPQSGCPLDVSHCVQAACSGSTPPQSGCPLDVSHCVLLQGKAQQILSQGISSGGFSSGCCWQDLLQNRGWWRRLDCKATVFSIELHVDILVHKVKWCTFVLQSGHNMRCIAFWGNDGYKLSMTLTTPFTQPMVDMQAQWHFPTCITCTSFVTVPPCTGGLHSTGYSVGQSHQRNASLAASDKNW